MPALPRPLFGGLLSICLFASVANGATERTSIPNTKLLSYSQLMSLSDAKREAYLKEVRAMIVDLANRRGRSGLLTESAREANSQVAMIDSLMKTLLPNATAQYPVQVKPPPPNPGEGASAAAASDNTLQAKDPTKHMPFLNLVNERPVKYKNSTICDSDLLEFELVGGDKHTGYCRTNIAVNEDCPEGFVPVKQNDKGSFYCATRASFTALPENMKADLVKPNGPKDKQDAYIALWRTTEDSISAEDRKAAEAAKPVDLAEVLPTQGKHGGWMTKMGCSPNDKLLFVGIPKNIGGKTGEGFCRIIGDTTTSCPEGFIGVNQRANGTFNCANRASFEKLPKEIQDKLRTPHSGASKEQQDAFKNMTMAPRKDVSKSAAGSNSCKLEQKECGGDPDELRAEYVKSGKNLCIYAGMINSYRTKTPQKGACKPENSFTLEAGKGALKCGPGERICNPLIFGVERDGDMMKPICTKETARATSDCNEQAMDAEEQKNLMKDLLTERFNGIAEQWDKFASNFNEICHQEASRNFFCSECNIIQSRVLALNINTTGDTCGQLTKFENFKTRNGGGSKSATPGTGGNTNQ